MQSRREKNKIIQEQIMNLGRLDNRRIEEITEFEKAIQELNNPDVLRDFYLAIKPYGYKLDQIGLNQIDIPQALEFGEVFLFHTIWERLNLSEIIQQYTLKGGGKELALFTEVLTIHRLCEPGSRERTAVWYPGTYLPLLLNLAPNKVYARVLLRSLNYLQPDCTRKIEKDLYANIKKEFKIETSRIDIDLTSTYFEGEECLLAEFGYSRDGKRDKLQIVVGLAVDNEGFLLTHLIFPGNKTDVTTLKKITHTLRKDFGVSKTLFVMDRGMISEENINYMDRKKDEYLIALELNNYEKEIVEEAYNQSEDTWIEIDEKISVTVLDKKENGRDKRYLIGINEEIAQKRRLDRESRLEKAREELRSLKRGISQGKTKSRQERERRIGNILKNNKVKKFIQCEGDRKGMGFNFKTLQDKLAEVERWDGAFIMVTTDTSLGPVDLINTYRERDRVEKAIRTLKVVLDIRPINVHLKEQVEGHIFICTLAYQLRRVAQQYLKDGEIDMSIGEALDALKRMKVVDIRVDKDEMQVHRMITTLDDNQKKLIEIFKIGDNNGQISIISPSY